MYRMLVTMTQETQLQLHTLCSVIMERILCHQFHEKYISLYFYFLVRIGNYLMPLISGKYNYLFLYFIFFLYCMTMLYWRFGSQWIYTRSMVAKFTIGRERMPQLSQWTQLGLWPGGFWAGFFYMGCLDGFFL